MFRVAHNTAIKHVSKDAKRTPASDVDIETLPTASDTEAAFDRARARARLLGAIQVLEPQNRELALLHLEGLPNTEIADVMGISPSNVSTRLTRLRAQLSHAVGGRHDA